MSTPVRARKSSPARCCAEPLPEDAKATVPGFALASATSSCALFGAKDGVTTSTFG